jgi:short-subunit dehydrogenase
MADRVFRDNVVIITGASSGIGRALAHALAAQGAWLALAARDAERLEAVAGECRTLGGRAASVPTDVGVQAQCQNLITRTVQEFGRIDTLINNAGISMWAGFVDITDPAVLGSLMQVNYLGGVYCTYYALPYLRQTQGRIVGVSSLAGKMGVPTRTGYAASKHAMAGFFDSLRIELADQGVSVTMIYPGFVRTEIRERALGADGRPFGRGNRPMRERAVMSAETCARLIVRAAARRQREEIMTLRGKVGQWVKLIAPGFVDGVTRRIIERGR